MKSEIVVTSDFFEAAYRLPMEISRKVFKALKCLTTDPQNNGCSAEPLGGKARGLWSIRVDDAYRIIYCEQRPSLYPIALFVATHDEAYRFAERVGSRTCTDQKTILEDSPTRKSERDRRPGVDAAIELDDLETIIKTRKYLPIALLLLRETGNSKKCTFAELEGVIGDRLPPSARKYRPWWANERGRHVQAAAWLGIGWKAKSVDLRAQTVVFERS